MDTDGVIQSIILVVLLFLSAFFSSSETALTTVNRLKLESLAEEGNKRAKKVLKLLEKPSKMLSTILISNNVVNISASALATTIAIKVFGSSYVAAATGILTLLVLVFGEITPKTMATVNNEKMALGCGGTILALSKILTPVIFIVDAMANGFLKLFRIDPAAVRTQMTEYEFRRIVEDSHEDGVIESEERQMIYNVVDLGDSMAKDIMIPRVDMTCVNVDATYDELKEVFDKEKFTRIPVYEDSTDNIIGIINMKDLLFVDRPKQLKIRDVMREANFTFEHKKTSDLLAEMRQNSIPMVLVLDEYGDTVGLITLEDLLEEIVGEIRDEFDEEEMERIQEIGDQEYLVEGSLKLDDINDALGTTFDSEDYDSIGGLIIEKLDHLPEAGESAELDDGTTLQVMEMDKNRIDKVKMILPDPADEEQGSENEETETE
ncbi:MAG: hemolysin family protein [Lachnospiraceae bacterium]|nr:hemolysin family protein [Lachnospiraceae bacterium]